MDKTSHLPYLSPFRVVRQFDGSFCTMDATGKLTCTEVVALEDPHPELIQPWQEMLGLPQDEDVLREMAKPSGLTTRRVQFIIADESPTLFTDGRRLRPTQWTFTQPTPLSLEHLGIIIGICDRMVNVPLDPLVRSIMSEVPEAEGNFLIGWAVLYDSRLAEAVWWGIQRGLFTHVCPIVRRQMDAPADSGELVDICLTHRPVCPGARILKSNHDRDPRAFTEKGAS